MVADEEQHIICGRRSEKKQGSDLFAEVEVELSEMVITIDDSADD